jgi:hypothetical protein
VSGQPATEYWDYLRRVDALLGELDARLRLILLLALRNPARNPLPLTCDGKLLRAHRLRIRFVDIPAGAFDIAGLRRPVGQVTRWPVSMFGHPARSSRSWSLTRRSLRV